MAELSGKELIALAKKEAAKHATKGNKFYVTMPNQACFIDLNEDQYNSLKEHAAEKKLSVHEFTQKDLIGGEEKDVKKSKKAE